MPEGRIVPRDHPLAVAQHGPVPPPIDVELTLAYTAATRGRRWQLIGYVRQHGIDHTIAEIKRAGLMWTDDDTRILTGWVNHR